MTAGPPSDPAGERVPLDEVMLAMDVVDTLRHERALVEAELDSDKRAAKLTARVKSIYESQGIEVSDGVIAEGVKALEEDRFVYEPPDRTLAVRLAEVYVERGKWARRGLVVAFVAVLVWFAFAIPADMRRRAAINGFQARVASLQHEARGLVSRARELDRAVQNVPERGPASVKAILAHAVSALRTSGQDAGALSAALDPGPDPETYPDAKGELDRKLDEHRERASEIDSALVAVDRQIRAATSLLGIGGELARVMTRLEGIDVSDATRSQLEGMQARVGLAVDDGDAAGARSELKQLNARVDRIVTAHGKKAAQTSELGRLSRALHGVELDEKNRAELDGLRTRVEQAIAAGDDRTAERELARLGQLVTVLAQEYELRIVSGVWRRPKRQRDKHNYYIIVEAISPTGEHLRLRVANEESGRAQRVKQFGVRVAKSVYEEVKADKLDNGLIDNAVFAVKKRGRREPEYRFPVLGGRITRW